MSFTIPPSPPARPNRCQLFGPGSRPELFPKMAASAADVVNLDLEDSVAPADKAAARANVIRAIDEIDWGTEDPVGAHQRPRHRVLVPRRRRHPRAGRRPPRPPHDPQGRQRRRLYAVDALASAVEAAKGRKKRIGFEVIIETALGFANVAEIAAASPRLQAMSLGAADFAASMGMQTTGIGGTQAGYYMLAPSDAADRPPLYGDPWHGVTAAIVAACRANGLLPVDGPFGDFSDRDGFLAQARRSATMGMVGKWAIHPAQVALANDVFTPSETQVAEARGIVAAMVEAAAEARAPPPTRVASSTSPRSARPGSSSGWPSSSPAADRTARPGEPRPSLRWPAREARARQWPARIGLPTRNPD